MICINKNLIRSTRDVFFNPENGSICTRVDNEDDVWKLDQEPLTDGSNCFRTVCKLYGHEIENRFKSYDKIYRALYGRNATNEDIPTIKYKNIIQDLSSELKTIWDKSKTDRRYFQSYHRPKMAFLSSMDNACIDMDVYKALFDTGAVDKTVLESFLPNDQGFASKPEYSSLGTKTGRLVVTNGPNINILPKDARTILKSRWEKGLIASVDFSSVEMQVLLVANGEEPKQDVYSDFSESYGLDLPRDVSKRALISAVYGAGPALVSNMVGSREKGEEIFDNAKTYLQTESLEDTLKEQCEENDGDFFSSFGRRLSHADLTNLINGYAQSTAVDVCIKGFENLTNIMISKGISFKKLFVLHDAIFFDLENEENYLELCKICNDGIDSFGIKYPIKIERL